MSSDITKPLRGASGLFLIMCQAYIFRTVGLFDAFEVFPVILLLHFNHCLMISEHIAEIQADTLCGTLIRMLIRESWSHDSNILDLEGNDYQTAELMTSINLYLYGTFHADWITKCLTENTNSYPHVYTHNNPCTLLIKVKRIWNYLKKKVQK